MEISAVKIIGYILLIVNFHAIYGVLTRRRSIFQDIAAFILTIMVIHISAPSVYRQFDNANLTLFFAGNLFCIPVFYLFKEHWTMKLFAFCMAFSATQYVRLLFCFVSAYLPRGFGSNELSMLLTLGVALLEAAALFFICRYMRSTIKYIVQIFHTGNVVVCLLPLATYIIMGVFRIRGVFDRYILISTVFITMILAVTFYLLIVTIQLTTRKNNLEGQLLLQMDHYKSLAASIQKSRIYRHDIRHHLAGITQFLEKRDMAAAQQYLDRLEGEYQESQTIELCKNKYIDAVLTHYFKIARQKGLSVTTQFELPEESGIEPLDVCVMIGVCFDHAIAACGGVMPGGSCQISLHGERVCDALVITLKNNNSQMSGSAWLDSIRLLIRRYDGDIQFSVTQDVAITVILLKMKTVIRSAG